ncbi:MAG: energy-coupled thiamine transporter ThiT [Christensenellaceae bacterium]|nr:energy-coupled thiamine transporter ThiT [Christensenellaceae bacterium]
MFGDLFKANGIITIVCIIAIIGGFLWLMLSPDKTSGRWQPQQLVVGALCLALAFVLSYIKLFEMPQGGCITPASMLPIILFSYIYGYKKGLVLGFAYGILNIIQGAYIVHWAQFILDYLFAFTVIGLGGICRKHIAWSILISSAGRFLFAVISGVVFFAEYAGEQNALIYSIVYNASYLIPEVIICLAITIIPAVNRMIEMLKKQYLVKNA